MNNAYPRWITTADGNKMIVQTRSNHMALTGKYVTEDGIEMDADPNPPVVVPSTAEVLAAGYSPEAAVRIIAREQARADESSEPKSDEGAAGRVKKLYECGCIAGPGPANMPDYCSEHGKPEDTAETVTVPYEEGSETHPAEAPAVEDEAGIFG